MCFFAAIIKSQSRAHNTTRRVTQCPLKLFVHGPGIHELLLKNASGSLLQLLYQICFLACNVAVDFKLNGTIVGADKTHNVF